MISAVLLTNGAAQIVARARKMVGAAPEDFPVRMEISLGSEFEGLLWTGVVTAWIAVVIETVASFAIARRITGKSTLLNDIPQQRVD